MVRIENDCVGCDLPCLGNSCPYKNVPHVYCDECEAEEDKFYKYEGQYLCQDCLLQQFEELDVADIIQNYND